MKKEQLKKEKQISNDNEIKNIENKLKTKISTFLAVFFFAIAVLLMVLKKAIMAIFPVICGIIDICILLKMYKEKGKSYHSDADKIEKEIEKMDEKINDLKLKNSIIDTEKLKIDEKLEKLMRG